jgi:saccharopine dehydrogenase-like NADP-dependent oxidoreductase
MLDRFDAETGTTSMARTTGYTCAIAARQVLSGLFTRKGICPPEYLGATEGCYEHMLTELKRRNIHMEMAVTDLSAEAEHPEINRFQRKIA